MFNVTLILVIILLLAAVVAALIAFADAKKTQPVLSNAKPKAVPTLIKMSPPDFPDIPDRPAFNFEAQPISNYQPSRQMPEIEFEPIDDRENALLKAAEIVVEKVQDVIEHIASAPPNVEEVLSKLGAILRIYTIFHGTEYFDAINSFIAISVERDCNISLSKEQILSLWD